MKIEFSIVIPLFNEEKRCKKFLNKLTKKYGNFSNIEIIFVNDGSTDKTLEILLDLKNKFRNIKLINNEKNMGKGFSVKRGVLSSRGKKIIMVDGDGSLYIEEIEKIARFLEEYDVVIGNRNNPKSYRPFKRKILSRIFNWIIGILFNLQVSDILCGAKGFRNGTIPIIFKNLKLNRWSFDIEIILRARKHNLKIKEIPIRWNDQKGSKIRIKDIFILLYEILSLRFSRISF